ncbi:MAG: hypothetical protein ABIA77_01070 [Candidatus Omnitrophota bacterium]
MQPYTLFTRPDAEATFFTLASGYLGFYLMGIEDDPRNRNIVRIKHLVDSAVRSIKETGDIPDVLKETIPDEIEVLYDESAVIIDLGPYKIRYFNHSIPGTQKPGGLGADNPYNIIQTHIGRYLSRQILTRKEIPHSPAGSATRPRDTFATPEKRIGLARIAALDTLGRDGFRKGRERRRKERREKDRVSEVAHTVSRRFENVVEDLIVRINREMTVEFLKWVIREKSTATRDMQTEEGRFFISQIKLLLAGLGGSGKSTIVRELARFIEEAGEKKKNKEYDDHILPGERRPIDPATGKTTEVFIEKFEHTNFIKSTKKLFEGEVIFEPVFDSKTRARLEIERREDGKIVVHNGDLKAVFDGQGGEARAPVLITEDGEGKEKTGSSVELGKKTFHAREAGGKPVLGLYDTEYMVEEDKIGLDVVSFHAKKDLRGLPEEDFMRPGGSDPEMIYFARNAAGDPVLEFKKEKVSGVRVRTLDIKVQKNNDRYDLYINNDFYEIEEKKWDNGVLLIKTKWFGLEKGRRRDFLQKISPDSSIFLIEGNGATADKELNKDAVTVAIDADPDVRLVRMLKRFETETGRKIDRDEFIEKRLILLRTEEVPFLIPWLKNCEFRICNHSLPESIFVSYKKRLLGECEEALAKIGLTPREIEEGLQNISFKKISSIIEKKGFVGDSFELEKDSPSDVRYFYELYTKKRGQYGLVVAVPTDEKVFSDKIVPMFNLMKERLGDLMVRSAVYDLSKSAKDVIIGSLPHKCLRKLGKVMIKNSVEASVEHIVRDLLASGDPRDMAMIKEILRKFAALQMEMSRRGIVDIDPSLKKYAFDLIIDNKTGEKKMILNSVSGFSNDPADYAAENYSLSKVTGLDFPAEITDYYDELLRALPDKETFKGEYFESDLEEASAVANPFDIDVVAEQIAYLSRIFDQRDVYISHREYVKERDKYGLDRTDSFFAWLKICQLTLKERDEDTAGFLGRFFNEMLDRRDLVENGEWAGFFKGFEAEKKKDEKKEGKIPPNARYELLKKLELFECDGLEIVNNGDGNENLVRRPDMKTVWDKEKILKNAGSVIPWLVQTMINISENIAVADKQERVVLLLDTELSERSGGGPGQKEIERLICMLADIKDNNKETAMFLKNLEIVKGRGKGLLNKTGGAKAENIIVITKDANMAYFEKVRGRAVIAAIDDTGFPEDAYFPLLEVALLAIGKYLRWDKDMLIKHYARIPNVVPLEDLDEKDHAWLSERDARDMVIKLVPDAAVLNTADFVETMARIRDILSKA